MVGSQEHRGFERTAGENMRKPRDMQNYPQINEFSENLKEPLFVYPYQLVSLKQSEHGNFCRMGSTCLKRWQ